MGWGEMVLNAHRATSQNLDPFQRQRRQRRYRPKNQQESKKPRNAGKDKKHGGTSLKNPSCFPDFPAFLFGFISAQAPQASQARFTVAGLGEAGVMKNLRVHRPRLQSTATPLSSGVVSPAGCSSHMQILMNNSR